MRMPTVVLFGAWMSVGCSWPAHVEEAQAQRAALSSPVKVIDLMRLEVPRPTNVRFMYPVDAGLIYFAPEPFFTDGSGAPAVPLGDLLPGPWYTAALGGFSAATVEGVLFFRQHAVSSSALTAWRTDGTLAGTRPAFSNDAPVSAVAGSSPLGPLFEVPTGATTSIARVVGTSLTPFLTGTSPSPGVVIDGGMVFAAVSGRRHLYRTDGTDAGTGGLTTNRSDIVELLPLVPVGFSGRVWFGAQDSQQQLWSSDGTRAGTAPAGVNLRDVSAIQPALGGLALVAAAGGSPVVALSDGTDAGTRILHGLGSQRSFGTQLLGVSPTHVFFSARTSGQTTWASSGTAAGTVQLAGTTAPGVVSGARYFFSDTSTGAPWSSDGTTTGTVQLSTAAESVRGLTALAGGRVIFFATSPGQGREVWGSDGTPQGTMQLASLQPGTSDGIGNGAMVVGDGARAWFECSPSQQGPQLCVSDGTMAGTRVATASRPGYRPSGLVGMTTAGSHLVIRSGGSLVLSDGTGQNTAVVSVNTNLPPLRGPDGTGWFLSSSPVAGQGVVLWKTDGTPSGTGPMGGPPGGFGFAASVIAATPRAVFVQGSQTGAGDILWAWRPDAGVEVLPDFTPAPGQASRITNFTTVGDQLLFGTEIPDGGFNRLASSDGTVPGTRLYAEGTFGVVGAITSYRGEAWFSGATQGMPQGFFRTNLADGGLVPVLRPGPSPSTVSQLLVANDTLYVYAGLPELSLSKSDATGTSVTPLVTVGASILVAWRPWGEGGVFITRTLAGPVSTFRLFVTDGTPGGTRELPDTRLEADVSGLPILDHALGVADAGFFFGTWTHATGLEPSSLEPSALTPARLADLAPGALSSNPRSPVVLGDRLYFIADDDSGDAVYAVSLSGQPFGGGAGGGMAAGGSAAGGVAGGSGGGTQLGGGAAGGTASAGGAAAIAGGAAGGGAGMTTPPGCGCTSSHELLAIAGLVALLGRRSRARRS